MANISKRILMTVLLLSVSGFYAEAGSERRSFAKSAFQKAMSNSEKDFKKTSSKVKKHRKTRAEESDKFGNGSVQLQVSAQLDVQAAHGNGHTSAIRGLGEGKQRLSDNSFNEDFESELNDSAMGLTESDEIIEEGQPHRHMAAEAIFED